MHAQNGFSGIYVLYNYGLHNLRIVTEEIVVVDMCKVAIRDM